MNLPAAIRTLYPAALADDYELRDDGDGTGPYLARWNEAKLGPAPKTAAILAEAAKQPVPEPEAPRVRAVLVPTGRVMLRRALGEALAAEDSARRGWAMAEGARALAEADLDVKRGRPGRISDELSGAETRIATHPGRLLAAVNFLSLTENQQSLVMDHAALLDRRDELIANAQRAADEIAAGEDEVVALTDRALAAREVYDAAKLAVDAVRIRAMNAED